MFKKNAVRYVTAWLVILLALGLIDYAHLHAGASHSRVATPAPAPALHALHASPATTPPATKPDRVKSSTTSPTRTVVPPVTNRPHRATPVTPTTTAPPAAPVSGATRAPAGLASVGNASPTTAELTYVVQPNDTLWDLAAAHLGNPLRWTELFALNQGRPQPGGQTLVNPDLIYAGWTLEFPAGATGLGSAIQAAHQSTAKASASAQVAAPAHLDSPNGRAS